MTASPSEFLADFDSKHWCRAIIEDPAFKPFPMRSRSTQETGRENTLFAITLYTHDTIRACLNFWREGSPAAGDASSINQSRMPLPTDNELTMLVSIGGHMNSHSDTLHGGIAVMLMDEAVACCVLAELKMDRGAGNGIFTRSLEVTYSGRIVTSGVVRVRAWKNTSYLKEGEKWGLGRKIWTNACIEDGEGRILVEGKYLFMRAKGHL